MTPEEFIKLYEKYIAGECSAEEQELLFQQKERFRMKELQEGEDVAVRDRVYRGIEAEITRERKGVLRYLKLWHAVAAAVLVAGIVFLSQQAAKQPEPLPVTQRAPAIPVAPGAGKAVLVLANGAAIQLDQVKKGLLSSDDKALVKKTEEGAIAYEPLTGGSSNTLPEMNTLYIPRSKKYQLTLADGTKVWLNAETSLRFPSAFSSSSRVVELKGEAYFEVAGNKEKPFRVITDKVTVEVLGTHFNINAYTGEAMVKTTLLQGAVRLLDKNSVMVLKPGEEGTTGGERLIKGMATGTEATAWKDGYFIFRENTIDEIMKQLARWYDVEVVYSGQPKQDRFGGMYSRSKTLPELLKALELTGNVQFRTDGKKITVIR